MAVEPCTAAETAYALRSILWYGMGVWLLLLSASLVFSLTRDALRHNASEKKRENPFSLLADDKEP